MIDGLCTVIIVEDEVLLLENLAEKVRNLNIGFQVIGTANNGKNAMEMISRTPPDAVLTDIRMPLMDGLELVEWLDREYVDVCKIIISGYSEFEYARRAIHFGVQDYLLKPISTGELKNTLLSVALSIQLRKETPGKEIQLPLEQISLEQVVQYVYDNIRTNYSHDIDLNCLIEDYHYSADYINRLFIKKYHESAAKYQIRLRINKAKQLLLSNHNLSVKQIAEHVGYSDQSYFSRIFKKYTGVSPLDYRK